MLPLFELDIFHTTVGGLAKYVHKFIELRGYQNIHLLGNSLGGHVALVHVLKHPEKIKSLILTGSSGLFENGMGDTYPKRGDYDYIKKKTELLKKDFLKLFPAIDFNPEFSWAGTFGSRKDSLPYIGTYNKTPHTYYALGFGGNGITFSLIAAQLITDMIKGRKNKDADLFAFNR